MIGRVKTFNLLRQPDCIIWLLKVTAMRQQMNLIEKAYLYIYLNPSYARHGLRQTVTLNVCEEDKNLSNKALVKELIQLCSQDLRLVIRVIAYGERVEDDVEGRCITRQRFDSVVLQMDGITDLDFKPVLSTSYISSEVWEEDAGNDLGFANE